ncbi:MULTISPECIES: SusC/RagA family TonB-linked outer membrane protein [unclassified Carboxylicivirga]|uniref:SusC/RagA family TonB-linked outer membrane protein n=1 Tax=Carboxylicivirga TaxID=1628153 RepID=UPI003D33C46F
MKTTRRRLKQFLAFVGLVMFITFSSYAQGLSISGNVKDKAGEPVPGVTVLEKGTTNGTITDFDGNYAFTLQGDDAVLVFSFIGMKTTEAAVAGQSRLNVVLEAENIGMDEVVVVGYGSQKKVNLTGSVAAVKFDDVVNTPVANTANMLQGRLPGVVLTNNGGQAGKDSPQIRIRGIGTLSDNNDPMVLIDGVESTVSQMSQIGPNDIENVSVLKDAASASIYGVRAANGVILITTKRGQNQKPTISYAGSVAIQRPTVLADYLNSADWAVAFNEAKGADIYTPEMIQKLNDGSDPDNFANTDWLDEMFRTAPMHQHHLSMRGGNEHTRYMFSTQYSDQDGIMLNTGSKRYGFRSNIDSQVGILTFGLNVSGSKQDVQEPLTSVSGEGLMRMITWFTRPTVPVKYSNGHYAYMDGTSLSHTIFKNPIHDIYAGNKTQEQTHFDGKAFAKVDILKNLSFRTNLAYKLYRQDVSAFKPTSKKYDVNGNVLAEDKTNRLADSYVKTSTILNENVFDYQVDLGEHDLTVMVGHSTQQSRTDLGSASIEGFPTNNIYELDGGSVNPTVSGSAYENSLQSFFGRVGYNFNSKYLFEMNIRHDGSSRMPKANRYATFPSFSVGWNIDRESFMENLDFLTALKLRGSWGKLGNQEIGNYAYMQSLIVGANYYFGDNLAAGLKKPNIANDKLKWETTAITDIGLDAAFFDNKLTLTADWFNKETSDILLRLAMPPSFLGALSAPYQNAGVVRNRGWELAANYREIKNDFSWQVGFNLSSVDNEIVDNKGIADYGFNTVNREGYAINSYYGLKSLGLYRTEADLQRTTVVDGVETVITQYGNAPQLGDIMYEDVNGDGNINDDDRMIIGNPFPKFQYGINLGFSYKNFDLSMFWQGVGGIDRYNWEQTTLSNGGNMTTRWLDRYSSDNTDGSMPRLGETNNDKYSSFWLTKADYLRLKSLEIGYNFKPELLSGLGVQSLRAYVAGSNLLTFTSLDNFDPEKTSGDMRNDVHPNTQTFSFGVNVSF